MVYTPEEDSYLILDCIQKEINLYDNPKQIKFLDMGTGSGIISLNIYKKLNLVYAVDVDSKAIDYVKSKLKEINSKLDSKINKSRIKNIHLFQSNLFTNLNIPEIKFDIISFNPPYLPNEKKIDNDVALNGGKKGYEIIFKFLEQAKDHLNLNGRIILLFSSFSKRNKILNYAKELGYDYELLAKKRIFFENLYVYRFKPKEYFISHGKRGKIYYFEKNKKKFIRKTSLKQSTAQGNIENEARFNKILNKNKLGPEFISYDKKTDSIIREYVEGEFIGNYLETHSKKEILEVIKKIFTYLLKLDELGINKFELTNPYKHIIVKKNGSPELIDFERCKFTENPKNITQFMQYLSSENIQEILHKKKINFNKKDLHKLAKLYKKNLNKNIVLDFFEK